MDTAVSGLGYVGVETRDLEAWRGFATDVLGMEEAGSTIDGGRVYRMDDRHHRLALHAGERDDLAYAGWEIENAERLEALASHLSKRGCNVEWSDDAEARRVAKLIRVSDPNGIVNEVFCGPSSSERPFRSPRSLGGFVTDRLGMGHVLLCVDDLQASLAFYRDGLGMKLSDYITLDMGPAGSKTAAFLHAGPRHHALALLPVAAPKRLHHLMLQLARMDDVGTTYDLCRDRDIPITLTMGRHTNDRMTSFYMESPSGFHVEYGHGGIEIDDDDWTVAHYDAPSIWGHRPDVSSP